MESLIQITNVPILIKMKTTNAQIQRKRQNVEHNISRTDGGGLRIESKPIRLSIDTFEARNTITPTTRRSIEQAAEKGKTAAYEETAKLAREDQWMQSYQEEKLWIRLLQAMHRNQPGNLPWLGYLAYRQKSTSQSQISP